MADYPTRQPGIYTRACEKEESTAAVRQRRCSPAADDGRWTRGSDINPDADAACAARWR